jgi:7-cyano-7-deazaguanine synthase in queuosine biosynthesis
MSDAYKTVMCMACERVYVCTPSDDYYYTPDGRGICESCLLREAGMTEMRVLDEGGNEVRDE